MQATPHCCIIHPHGGIGSPNHSFDDMQRQDKDSAAFTSAVTSASPAAVIIICVCACGGATERVGAGVCLRVQTQTCLCGSNLLPVSAIEEFGVMSFFSLRYYIYATRSLKIIHYPPDFGFPL